MSQKSRVRFLGLSALAAVVLSSLAPINVGGVSADYPPVTPVPVLQPTTANGTPVTPPLGSGFIRDAAGTPVAVKLEVVGDKVSIGTNDFKMEFDLSKGEAKYEDKKLTFVATEPIVINGVGFAPGSIVEVWLFSTPRLLGTAVVKADGTFSLSVAVPVAVEGGSHTLQAEGLNTAGQPRTISAPVIVKTAISSAQINFDSNSSRLTAASQASLSAYAKKVKDAKFTKVSVTGYTDAMGTSASNLNLSRARAETVAAFLKTKLKGSKVAVNVSYKGKSAAIGSNSTDKGRATNRRVELFAS
jgi:outer membrane protein OmpA-like peptidoglycan-associated protein